MKENKQILDLALAVHERVGMPVNAHVVRAVLESTGLRETDVISRYQMEGFDVLAKVVFDFMHEPAFKQDHPEEMVVDEQFHGKELTQTALGKLKTKYFLSFYPLGLFHGVPVFLQIATIIVFGYSMWTWVGFNQLQSTAVVLGVIFGLIGTGGFVQVIGRQVSHYWLNHDFAMAKRTTILVFRDALIFMGSLALALLVIDFFANFYPYKFLFLVYAYSFSIGILLLLSAVFHPLKERWVIVVAFVIASGVSLSLKLFTPMNTYFTHWIGIWLANVIMLGYLIRFFRRKVKQTKVFNRATSKSAVMIYRNYKYFFYGLLFFIFIFIDRILAWSTTDNGTLPYIVFYEKNYEIGMDIAIVIFFLLVGVLEYGISAFSTISDLLQKQISFNQVEDFNKKAFRMYKGHVVVFLITAMVMALLMYSVIWLNLGYERAFEEALDPISIKVSLIGGLGYVLVAWGMLNSLYLFTLNKPSKPLAAMATATLVNFFVGLICSRLIGYEYSVIGFLAGSIVYAVITYKHTAHFFKNLDFYYYAAY